jgi:3-hydroxyacyl-CoA dehydrogenase
MGTLELRDMTGGWKIMVSSEADRRRTLGEKGRVHPLVQLMVRSNYTRGKERKRNIRVLERSIVQAVRTYIVVLTRSLSRETKQHIL